MKKYIVLLSLLIVMQTYAQSDNKIGGTTIIHYVLDKFYPGKVYMQSCETANRMLNYNTLTKEMIFEEGGKYLAIANPQQVDSVVISGRTFIYADNKFYEWIAGTNNKLYVDYQSTIVEEGVPTGYGNSQTASAHTIKSLVGSGLVYGLKLPDDYKVSTKINYYLIKGKAYEKFANARQLTYILPDKKQRINDWVKNNNTDFNKPADLIALVNQLQ
jgi:hypothetical protein